MRKFITLLTFLLAAMAVLALPALGQSVSQAFTLTVDAATRTAEPTAPLPNVGQSFNQAYGCIEVTAGTSITAEIELEASLDGSSYFAISPAATITNSSGSHADQCASISGNGYYAAVRLLAFNVTGTGTSPAGTITGTYSGSVGTAPAGGEVRAGGAAEKVSPVPFATDFASTTLKSTGQIIQSAPTAASGLFIYTVMVDNPNASAVYVAIDANSDPLFNDSGVMLAIPVPASTITTVNLTAPAYAALASGSINIACSSSPTASSDPSSACIVSVLNSLVGGANANVTVAGQILQIDNSSNVIPH